MPRVKVVLKCAIMMNGGQCVMDTGVAMMLLLPADNWDMMDISITIPTHISVKELEVFG